MTKRKDRFVHCRLSEADFERFHAHAEELELAPSEYLRYMIRIPVDAEGADGKTVVLDTKALSQIYGELVRWATITTRLCTRSTPSRSSSAEAAGTSTTSSSSSRRPTATS